MHNAEKTGRRAENDMGMRCKEAEADREIRVMWGKKVGA